MTCRQSLHSAKYFGWLWAFVAGAWVLGVGCQRAELDQNPVQTEEQFSQLCASYPKANLTLGRRLFLKHCSVCHQASGSGASRAIPPLRGHIVNLAAHPSGRSYLAQLVLFGLNGPIRVNGQKYYNAMPPLGALMTDHELAAALNYAQISWGNDAYTNPSHLVLPADIAQARLNRHNASQTLAVRKRLWPDGEPPQADAISAERTAD